MENRNLFTQSKTRFKLVGIIGNVKNSSKKRGWNSLQLRGTKKKVMVAIKWSSVTATMAD
jgi:hypothetical protein